MPYRPGLRVDEQPPSKQQSARYDNLANFAAQVLTVAGKPRYTEASLRRQLAASRVLTKDGMVRENRMNKLMEQLGYDLKRDKNGRPQRPLPGAAGWERIAEGESP